MTFCTKRSAVAGLKVIPLCPTNVLKKVSRKEVQLTAGNCSKGLAGNLVFPWRKDFLRHLIISKIKRLNPTFILGLLIFVAAPSPSAFAESPNIVNIGVATKGNYVVMNARLIDENENVYLWLYRKRRHYQTTISSVVDHQKNLAALLLG
jgi:hypothetical protein